MRRHRKSLLLAAVTLVAAGLLLFATAAAGVYHHHNNAASEANCPICHLSHQVAMGGVTAGALPYPLARCGGLVLRFVSRRPGPLFSLIPARAPPAV